MGQRMIGGAGDEQRWSLRGARQVVVRAARESDETALRRFIDGLTRESRYFRFLSGSRVPDEAIRSFVGPRADAGRSRDVTLVVMAGDEVVANAMYVVNDADEAEFAVVVADAWQGHGLGRRLIQHLQQRARAAGLRGMRGDVLSENRRMLAIVRGLGFGTRRHPEDSYLHEVSLRLTSSHREDWLARDWFEA